MGTIRVVWGTASAETPMLSYDAALADAGVHDYNLVAVSSVIPADASVEQAGTASDLGPAGGRLTVVEARTTVPPGEGNRACAGLGWSRAEDGPGVFYEGSGGDPVAVREEVEAGLRGGEELRDREFGERTFADACAPADFDRYTTAVVLAVYGDADPVV